MKINTVIALLGLTWIGSSEAGQYAVGSFAEIKCNEGTVTIRAVVTAIDAETGDISVDETNPQGKSVGKLSKRDAEDQRLFLENMSSQCIEIGGHLDMLTVPAGTFRTCKSFSDDDNSDIYLADVPFLVAKVVGQGMSCELNSYKW